MFGINIQFERWRFNKKYQTYVSTLGRFKNQYRQLILPNIDNKGYPVLNLCHVNTNLHISAHRLVMETYRPNNKGMTIDHINQNKRDPRLKNLEWVTQEENLKRANNNLSQQTTIDGCYRLINQMLLENKLTPDDIHNAILSRRSLVVQKQKNKEQEKINQLKKAEKEARKLELLKSQPLKKEFSLPLLAAFFIKEHTQTTDYVGDIEKKLIEVLQSKQKKCYGLKVKIKDKGCIVSYTPKGE